MNYGTLPLSFEINKGQTNSAVRYLARTQNSTLFLTNEKAVLVLNKYNENSDRNKSDLNISSYTNKNINSKALSIKPINSNLKSNVVGIEKLHGIVNYFKGNKDDIDNTNIETFKKVKYQDIYPNIDMIYYSNNQQFEWDFIIAPGADTKTIALEFEGINKLEINTGGDLLLSMGVEEEKICFHKPIAYQEINGLKINIPCNYIIIDNCIISFDISEYSKEYPLIIDPILDYSTFLGNSSFIVGNGIAVDIFGNAYICGDTINNNFPSNIDPYDPYVNSTNAFITKINNLGTAVVYTTLFGGNNFTSALAIALDSFNNAYITGMTNSTDFPHEITTADLLAVSAINQLNNTTAGGYDAYVIKLDSTGTGLIYSLLLGGKNDDTGNSIAVDSIGNAYITGTTFSSDFPTKNPIFLFHGKSDAFITKINPSGTNLVYSTFLGGNDYDYGNGIDIDLFGNAYVIGSSLSPDFPIKNPFDLYKGMGDVFITKINSIGTEIIYSTYLGGSKRDMGRSIAVDQYMNAYVTGSTESSNFTIKNTLYNFQGKKDAFVAKLDENGELAFSTFLVGSNSSDGNSITLDSKSDIYVTGSTDSANFPTKNPLFLYKGETDVFIVKLKSNGSELLFSTFLGSSFSDIGQSIAVDTQSSIYVTGETHGSDFPVKNPIFQYNGHVDGFVTKISDLTPSPRSRGFDFFK